MSDLLKISKKVFTIGVVATTILWSVGASVLVGGVAVAASTCPTLKAGDNIKVVGRPAIYSVNKDLDLMYYPSGNEFKSWYSDSLTGSYTYKGKYISVSQACFDSLETPTVMPVMVNYRPGSKVLKRPSSDQLYVILPDNTKQLITDAAAKVLYGASYVPVQMSDVFWPGYVNTATGTLDVDSSGNVAPHQGMLVKVGTKTYYVDSASVLKEVDATGMTANRFNSVFVMTLDSANTSGMTMSTELVSAEVPTLTDVTQGVGDGTSTVPPVTTAGTVEVSLSANTPDAGNVVLNVNSVFGKFVVKNTGSADVKVNSVKIGRTGLGATADFNSVSLYDGTTKIGTTKTSWSSNGYMTYNISGGWTVSAGTSKELTIKGNLGTAAKYNALGILDLSLSAGTVSGAPVYANQMTGVNVTVGRVTITGQGTAATKKIGTTNVDLAKFRLAISSVEDASFEGITLKNKAATSNASDADVSNVYLYKGSTKLAGPVSMVSDKIKFTLDTPFDINKSKNETFTVKGDIVNGDGNTIEYVLDNATDLIVTGKTYNTYLAVTSGAYDVATEGSIITISGAELNVAFSSSALDTANDRTDVTFGTLTLGSGATDVKITNFVLGVDENAAGGSGAAQFDVDEFEMVDNADGTTYSGTMTGGGDGDDDSEIWTFTDEVYLTAGETRTFTVRGDIPNSVTSSDAYRVTSTISSSYWTAETVPAGDAVSSFSIGSFTGNWVTVKDAYLTAKATPLNVGNAVAGDTNVILYKGTLEATAGDVHVEAFDFEADTTLGTANWSDLGLYTVDSAGAYTLVQNITNASMTSGTLQFDSVDLNVVVGSANKVTFVVKGTIASSIDSGNNVAKIKLDYITGKDGDNDSVTTYNSAGTAIANGGTSESTTRQITLYAKGILYVQMRNADSGFNKDRVLLAGTDVWVGKIRMRSVYEDILVKDVKLTNNVAAAYDVVEQVCLYTAQSTASENLAGCTTVDSGGVAFFDDINYTVVQGTHDLYLYVETNSMSAGATGTSDSKDMLQFAIVTSTDHLTAEGVASGFAMTYAGGDGGGVPLAGEIGFDKNLNGTYGETADAGGTASTTKFYTAGTKISSVALVSSYGGETVDTLLSGTGAYTAAILQLTTEANSNTDANGDALLLAVRELRFDATKYASTTITAATVERIGGSQGAKSLTVESALGLTTTTAGDILMTNVTTTLGNDAKISAGDTAYFVVKVTVGALNTATGIVDWFRVGLDDVKGTAGSADTDNNIDWFDGYDTTYAAASDFDYLLLDTTSVTGAKIAESL
ncbi:MAG: hypothetical protein ABH832_02955 [bacterium]